MIGPWIGEVAALAACAPRGDLLDDLDRLVLEGRLDEADARVVDVVEAFGCGGPASADEVARLWLARALLLGARGDAPAADDALAAAAHASPNTWNELFGAAWKERWSHAAARPAPPRGRVDVAVAPGAWVAFDGRPSDPSAELSSGPHLLQVGADGPAAALWFDLAPGEHLELALPGAAPADPVLPASPAPARRRPRVGVALLVGGLAAASYGASFGTRALYYGDSGLAGDQGLQSVNNGLVVGSIGLAATSGALLVRAVAAPGPGRAE